jgi:hypothetical protein
MDTVHNKKAAYEAASFHILGPLVAPLLKLRNPPPQLRNLRPLICQLSVNSLDLRQCLFQGIITWSAATGL